MRRVSIAAILLVLLLAAARALPPNTSSPLVQAQGATPVSLVYHNQIVGPSGTGTFGPAASGRIIIVGAAFTLTSGGTFTGLTVSGVAATRRQRATVVGGGSSILGSDIWTATVPSGTSGTVSVTTTNLFSMSMAVATIYNSSSEGGSSGTNATAAGSTTLGSNLVIPTNGVGLGNALCNAGSAASMSWANLTQQLSSNFITNAVHGFAISNLPGSATRTETCSAAGTQMLAVNAWGP